MRITFRRATVFGRKPKPYRRHTLVAFFQDPAAVNWATWAGLAVSIVGFGVSIQQIVKVKNAARAAEQATKSAFSLIKDRVNLTEVTTALSYIDAIERALYAKDFSGALGTMRLLRAKLIALGRLSLDGHHRGQLGSHLTTLGLLSDELTGVLDEGRDFRMVPFMRALQPIGDTLNDYAVQMRYMDN